MAEQAVMIADLERETQGRQALLREHVMAESARGRLVRILTPSRSFARTLAAAASIAVFLSVGLIFRKSHLGCDIATITPERRHSMFSPPVR